MPGMLAGPVRERRKFMNRAFMSGWSDYTPQNDAADQIVESPDKFLLNQSELFDAEGGWTTFALTMGLASAGAAGIMLSRPGMAAHFGRGQLRAMEWGMVTAAALAGGCVGNQLGIQTFGDSVKYTNHWMVYTFVKSQNRFLGGSTLTDAPTY